MENHKGKLIEKRGTIEIIVENWSKSFVYYVMDSSSILSKVME